MTERVALYLQDAHDLRDGLNYVQYAEKKVLKLSGRLKAGWCGMRLCRWRLMRR